MWELRYADPVYEDLRALRAADRSRVRGAIEGSLMNEPDKPTRNRKLLTDVKSPLDVKRGVWELRVGEIRVFYDVDSDDEVVTVLWARRKPPHMTTENILP
jgi:mRNA-degrading endonuclease RelE of RelBE toxin-antitoxin system